METATVRRRDAEEGRASAGELTLERRADGKLWALRGDAERGVWVRRCFPWSEPGRFVSLRDEDDNEPALVGDPAGPLVSHPTGWAQQGTTLKRGALQRSACRAHASAWGPGDPLSSQRALPLGRR